MNQPLNTRSLLMAALIAGVGIGLLSGIPILNCLNVLLCAWVWLGGIAAVALYRRYERRAFVPTGQAAMVGAAAGVVGAIIGGVLSLLLGGVTTAIQQALLTASGETGVNIPDALVGAGFGVAGIFVNIIIYAIFGAIGGVIAAALIWKAPAAPVPPPPYNPPPPGPSL